MLMLFCIVKHALRCSHVVYLGVLALSSELHDSDGLLRCVPQATYTFYTGPPCQG